VLWAIAHRTEWQTPNRPLFAVSLDRKHKHLTAFMSIDSTAAASRGAHV
jgi:hypothetical protein